MIIRNAVVYTPEQTFVKKDVVIRNGLFAEDTKENRQGEEVLDAEGCYAIPGLLDIHFHGALGQDVSDGTKEAYEVIAKYEAKQGVTAICPATLTLPVDDLCHILSTGAAFAKRPHEGADLVGFNMEGPFISRAKKGAQNERYILKADPKIVEQFLEASHGLVKIIGLAPEENPGFEEYIRKVKGLVRVSLAHSAADYETAMRAFRAGACHAVHMFNAMTDFGHRAPGAIGAISDSTQVHAELICDGIHVHPAAVRCAFRLVGKERIVMISDSLRCTGMPDGEYMLGGQPIVKNGPYCRLKKEGNIAGSVSNLMECMKNAVKTMEIPLETAVACATIRPAEAIGVENVYGSIETGKKADLVLLAADGSLDTVRVIKDGTVIC